MVGMRELIIILVIVLLVFGTKRLANIGSDLGGAIKGFRSAMKDEGADTGESTEAEADSSDDKEKTP